MDPGCRVEMSLCMCEKIFQRDPQTSNQQLHSQKQSGLLISAFDDLKLKTKKPFIFICRLLLSSGFFFPVRRLLDGSSFIISLLEYYHYGS